MGELLFALLISLVVGGTVGFVLSFGSQKVTRGAIVIGILITLVAFGVMAVLSSWTEVEYGTVAVVTRFGGIVNYDPETGRGKYFKPGLNFKTPFIEQVEAYRTQKITYEASENPDLSDANYPDFQVDTTTQDGQRIKVRYTVRFRVEIGRVAWIAQNLGSEAEVVEKVIKTDSRIHARNIARQFPAAELYTGDVEHYQDAVAERLVPIFAANGLILDEFGVRSIIFEEGYASAIEQKQIEREIVITESYKADQQVEIKRGTITQAEAEAQKKEIEAEGEAAALRAKGQALRDYPEVLQLELIRSFTDPEGRITWGILPQGIIPFLDVLELEKQMEETP